MVKGPLLSELQSCRGRAARGKRRWAVKPRSPSPWQAGERAQWEAEWAIPGEGQWCPAAKGPMGKNLTHRGSQSPRGTCLGRGASGWAATYQGASPANGSLTQGTWGHQHWALWCFRDYKHWIMAVCFLLSIRLLPFFFPSEQTSLLLAPLWLLLLWLCYK